MKTYENKRGLKTILSFVLVAVMLFGMTACTDKGGGAEDFETLIKRASENAQKVESMTYTMVEDMEMSMLGMTIPMLMTMDVESISSPLAAKVAGDVDAGGFGSYKMDMYMVDEGSQIAVYTGMDYGDGEQTWMKQMMDINASEVSQYNANASISAYVDGASSFKEAGTEEINGVTTTKYEGILTGDAIAKAFENSGFGDQVGIEGEDLSALYGSMGDIPVAVWIDKEKAYLIRFDVDMSTAIANLMAKLMEEEENAEGMSVDISKAKISITITGVNNVSDVTVPEDVKANAQDMGDLLTVME